MKFLRKIFITVFLSFYTFSISIAQDPIPDEEHYRCKEYIRIQTHSKSKQDSIKNSTPTSEETIYTAVSKMPDFPGGVGELIRWINEHLEYPSTAMANNIQGRVVVQVVVTKDGSIGEVRVVRSVDHDLDNEAVRVAKSLPRFIPGEMGEEPVNVWYTIPIDFHL